MKTVATILISLAAVTLALAQSPSGQNGLTEIIVDRASSDIFPDSWRKAKMNPKAEPLPEEERERCREIMRKILAMYPRELLNRNLTETFVLGRLEFSGINAVGCYGRSTVYLVGTKHSLEQIVDLFHAEFSSILFRNYADQFDKAAWQEINPPDFTYLGSGVQAVKEKRASVQPSDDANEKGFMHEYAMASIEEDFNTFAARLLRGDAALWRAIAKYPRIKAKADLTIAFYGKLDSSFNAEFFSSLRQTR